MHTYQVSLYLKLMQLYILHIFNTLDFKTNPVINFKLDSFSGDAVALY